MDKAPWKTLMLWVRPEKIQPCHVDVNHVWGEGFSYVQSSDYLKDDKVFAVQVRMSSPYKFLEDEWLKKWNDPVVWEICRQCGVRNCQSDGDCKPSREGRFD